MSLMRMFKRFRHTARQPIKVAIIGAAGRIGRHLALLLKQNNDITEIALYDIIDVNGIREDLSHMDFNAWMTAFKGEECLPEAVSCSQLVVVAGSQSKSEKAKDGEDPFKANSHMIMKVMTAIATTNDGMPFIHIVTNPVNALVPMAAEVLNSLKKYDPRKLSGSTTVNIIRARTFIGQLKGKDPMYIKVPVIGGHLTSSVPLISKAEPDYNIDSKEAEALIHRVGHASLEVSEAYNGKTGSFLAVSYSAAIFCNSVIQAIMGKRVKEAAYIPCNVVGGLDYFATSFTMDAGGVKDVDPIPNMSAYEKAALEKAKSDISSGIKLAKESAKNLPKEK